MVAGGRSGAAANNIGSDGGVNSGGDYDDEESESEDNDDLLNHSLR